MRRSTYVNLQLPVPAWVNLGIYNVVGQLVRVLVDGRKVPGIHELSWDGRDGRGREVPGGVYFLRLEAEHLSATQKLVVLR